MNYIGEKFDTLTQLCRNRQIKEAKKVAQDILRVDKNHELAIQSLMELHFTSRNFRNAVRYAKRLTEVTSHNPVAFYNYAIICVRQGMFFEAVKGFKKAIELNPKYVEAHHQLGYVYYNLNQFELGEEYQRAALKLDNFRPEIYGALGLCLFEQGRLKEAAEVYETALKIHPDYVDAHCNLGITKLALGDYRRGFLEYDWRFKKYPAPLPEKQLWDGTSLSGRRLLVVFDGGAGDCINFARYVKLIGEQGYGSVIVAVPDSLLRLFSYRLDGADQVVRMDQVPEFDLWVSSTSLPKMFWTLSNSIPFADSAYLSVNPAEVASWVTRFNDSKGKFKIGIVWRGSVREHVDALRCATLNDFRPLFELPNAAVYSFQKDFSRFEADSVDFKVRNIGYLFKDFYDTAAAMKCMDLIVSVDTSSAHLAGSLGVDTILLLPKEPEWRWRVRFDKVYGVGYTHSAWYHKIKMFQLDRVGNWPDLISNVSKSILSLYELDERPKERIS